MLTGHLQVLLPYLNHKAQALFERLGGGLEAEGLFADEQPMEQDLSQVSLQALTLP